MGVELNRKLRRHSEVDGCEQRCGMPPLGSCEPATSESSVRVRFLLSAISDEAFWTVRRCEEKN